MRRIEGLPTSLVLFPVHRAASIQKAADLFKHQGRTRRLAIFNSSRTVEMMLTQKIDSPQPTPLGLILDGADRRLARRYSLNWMVKIRVIDRTAGRSVETGELSNLSSTGAAIRMRRALEVGARLEVLIRLPFEPERWIKYCGEALQAQVADSQTEVAIRFNSARPAFM
jgi:hypothetical protein